MTRIRLEFSKDLFQGITERFSQLSKCGLATTNDCQELQSSLLKFFYFFCTRFAIKSHVKSNNRGGVSRNFTNFFRKSREISRNPAVLFTPLVTNVCVKVFIAKSTASSGLFLSESLLSSRVNFAFSIST